MKVVLLERVSGLGNADDVKEVTEGYARNFLFPRHLAVLASGGAAQAAAGRQQKKAQEAETDLRGQQQLASKVEGTEVEFKEKMSEQGHLYAAIGAEQIAAALARKGFPVKKNQIVVGPVKTAGEHAAKVKFRYGLEAEVKIIVSN